MKRLLFSLIALFIMAGYAYSQNEAYVEQVGPSAGVGTQIYQNGTNNKVTGPGIVLTTPPTPGAAYLHGASNELTVIQDMAGTGSPNWGWIRQEGDGTAINTGVLDQRHGVNTATIDQTATASNWFKVVQLDISAPYDALNTAKLVQKGPALNNYAVTQQEGNAAGDNYYNVQQTTPGNNYIRPNELNTWWGGGFAYGIYQIGFNKIDDVTFDPVLHIFSVHNGTTQPTFQDAVVGNNYLSTYQVSSPALADFNEIAIDQDASTGNNVAALIQTGEDLNTWAVQNGTSSLLVGKQSSLVTPGMRIFSIHQVGAVANTAIFSQL